MRRLLRKNQLLIARGNFLFTSFVLHGKIWDNLEDRMTRGNQREEARKKAQKKLSEQQKKKGSGEKDGNKGQKLTDRKLRDAEVMRQKQLNAEAAKSAGSGGASGGK